MTELPGREAIRERRPDRKGMSPEARTVANELAVGAQAVAGAVVGGLILLAVTMALAATGFMYEVTEGWIIVCLGLALACGVATTTALRLLGNQLAGLRGPEADRQRHPGAEGSRLPASEMGPEKGQAERQLLQAIERHGEVTPARVALETSLTVAEADRMLGELAEKGHLEVRARDGKLVYSF